MSAAAAQRRWADFTDDLSRGTRMSAVVLAPISACYAVLALPVAQVLFEHGQFTRQNALDTSPVLLAAGLALVPFSVSQLYTFAFYALPDTRTPALVNVPVVGVRIGLQVWLAAAFGAAFLAAGLMLGNAVSFVLAAVVSGILLRRRVGPIGLRRIVITLGKALGAATGAAAVGLAVVAGLGRLFAEGTLRSLTELVVGGLAIGLAYCALAMLLRITELTDMLALVRRKLNRTGG